MTSQSLARFLKSHWLVAIIAVAVLAFLAGAFTSNRGVADEHAPTVASNPAATPTIPPELYATPTKEEFAESLRALRRKQAVASNDGENRSSRSIYTRPPTPAPRSTAEAQFRAASPGRALYFVASDKVIFLPEGVERWKWITAISCYGLPACPEAPVTVLKNGEDTVSLDVYGNVFPGLFETDDPDAFPFLRGSD